MSIQQNREEYMKNLQLLIKLQEAGLNSWGDEKPREKNREFKTPNSSKIIDDYNKDLETPYIDPITNEELKITPLPPPVLDEIDETKLIPIEASQDDIREEINNTTKQIVNAENDIKKLNTKLNRVYRMINERGESPFFNNEKEYLINQIEDLERNIQNYNDNLNYLMLLRDRTRENEEHNKNIIKETKQTNQVKLKNYKDELNQLNKGSLNLEQQPDETEEEYLARIEDVKATPYSNQYTISQANIYNIQKFKDNMKELIRNDVIIDQVLNSIKMDIEDGLYLFNQKFSLFKTDFLKKYGFNNENIKADTIIDEIASFLLDDKLPTLDYNQQIIKYRQPQYLTQQPDLLNEPENLLSFDETEEQEEQEEQALIEDVQNTFIKYELDYNNTTLKITNENNNRELYCKLRDVNGKEKIEVFTSLTGEPNSFKNIFFHQHGRKPNDRDLKYLFVTHLGLSVAEYRNEIPSTSQNPDIKTKAGIIAYLKGLGLEEDNENENFHIGDKLELGEREFSTYGMGLKLRPDEIVPKICSFGKIVLLLHKLYYKNILSIQNKNGLKLAGFKNTPISDGFVNIVMKLCRNQEPNFQDMNNLKASEKDLFDSLLQVAGLQKRNITGSGKQTIQNLKEKLALTEGQIEAGNNNEMVLDELYDILFKLVHFGVISEKQARTHYKQVKKEYF
jgi:hypothetical protein